MFTDTTVKKSRSGLLLACVIGFALLAATALTLIHAEGDNPATARITVDDIAVYDQQVTTDGQRVKYAIVRDEHGRAFRADAATVAGMSKGQSYTVQVERGSITGLR